jgi:D-sedoheptulose 7-phosphate isomerase
VNPSLNAREPGTSKSSVAGEFNQELRMRTFLLSYLQQLQQTLDTVDLAAVGKAVLWFQDARDENRMIFICGNGGSASTASHFATDLGKGASYGRSRRFRILALTDSISTVSAYSNDVGYGCVFVEQLKNFAQAGDLVVAISSSGNSPNVLHAVEYANSIGCRTLSMTGGSGGKLRPLSQLDLQVREPHTGRIEDAHLVLCHMIGYYFMGASD